MKKQMFNLDNHYDNFLIDIMSVFGDSMFSVSELLSNCEPFLEKEFQNNNKKFQSKSTGGTKSPAENFVHRFLSDAVEEGYIKKTDKKYSFITQKIAHKRFLYTKQIRQDICFLKLSADFVNDKIEVSSKLNKILLLIDECEDTFLKSLQNS